MVRKVVLRNAKGLYIIPFLFNSVSFAMENKKHAENVNGKYISSINLGSQQYKLKIIDLGGKNTSRNYEISNINLGKKNTSHNYESSKKISLIAKSSINSNNQQYKLNNIIDLSEKKNSYHNESSNIDLGKKNLISDNKNSRNESFIDINYIENTQKNSNDKSINNNINIVPGNNNFISNKNNDNWNTHFNRNLFVGQQVYDITERENYLSTINKKMVEDNIFINIKQLRGRKTKESKYTHTADVKDNLLKKVSTKFCGYLLRSLNLNFREDLINIKKEKPGKFNKLKKNIKDGSFSHIAFRYDFSRRLSNLKYVFKNCNLRYSFLNKLLKGKKNTNGTKKNINLLKFIYANKKEFNRTYVFFESKMDTLYSNYVQYKKLVDDYENDLKLKADDPQKSTHIEKYKYTTDNFLDILYNVKTRKSRYQKDVKFDTNIV